MARVDQILKDVISTMKIIAQIFPLNLFSSMTLESLPLLEPMGNEMVNKVAFLSMTKCYEI